MVRILHAGLAVEHLEDALGGRRRLLGHPEDPPERLDRPDDHEEVAHERDQPAERHRLVADRERADEQHRAEREAGQHVQDPLEVDDEPDALHRRVVQDPSLAVEPLVDEAAAAERLDRPDTGRALLDLRREIAGVVLHLARRLRIAPLEDAEDEHERHGHHHDHEGQERVEPREEHEHDEGGRPVDHEEDRAPADEAADGADVARGTREELPGVPVVVEAHVESLELRVQVVAELGLHTVGDDPEHVAAHERGERLDDAEEERETGQRGDSVAVTVGERAVDHRLRHQRDGDGRDQADEGDAGHDHERDAVRAQVRQDATKTSVTHGSPGRWTTNPTTRPGSAAVIWP